MHIKQALTVITRPLIILPLLSAIFLASTAIWGTAQDVKVKKTPVIQSDPSSGKQMYNNYCAPCHGIAGKGDGPAARSFKTPPTNLSLLAKNNSGQYPAEHFVNVLQFATSIPAHGSKDMPVWGELFHSLSASHGTERAESALRIHKLSDYVETLQTK